MIVTKAASPSGGCCQVAVWKHPCGKGGYFDVQPCSPSTGIIATQGIVGISPGAACVLTRGLSCSGRCMTLHSSSGCGAVPGARVWVSGSRGQAAQPSCPAGACRLPAEPGAMGTSHHSGLPAGFHAMLWCLPGCQPVSKQEQYN